MKKVASKMQRKRRRDRKATRLLAGFRVAVRAALNELGVPQPGYPQPVANAVEILNKAMAR